MKDKNIDAAVKAAKEFISRATSEKKSRSFLAHDNYTITVTSPAHTGALRRQSMELTRALSKMRNDR